MSEVDGLCINHLLCLLKGEAEDEDDEAKRNARVSQERQRTLDRLRSLKQVRLT